MVLLGIALRESLCEGDNAFWLQGPCLGAVGAGGTLGTLISELLGLAAVPKWPSCGSSACEMSDVPWCWGSSDSELHLLGERGWAVLWQAALQRHRAAAFCG